MTDDPTPIDGLVPVYVRPEHLAPVYELLGRLMTEHPPRRSVDERSVFIDVDQGEWSQEEFDQLLLKIDGTVLGRIVGQIALASPGWIGFSTLVERLDESWGMVRAQLGTLTKYSKSITGRKTWPFSAQWRGTEMAYSMPAVVSEWWRQTQQLLVELDENQRG